MNIMIHQLSMKQDQKTSLNFGRYLSFDNKNFFIPDYQRGYRWGTRQVEQLLDDLCAFFDRGKGQFYCLQPIVVKEITKDEDKNKYALISKTDNNRWYEVIDGQQRLTTIRIIFTMAL